MQDAVFDPLAVAWLPAVQNKVYLLWPFVLSVLVVRRRLSLHTCVAVTLGVVGVVTLWRTVLAGMDIDINSVRLRTDFNLAGILRGCADGLAFAAGMVPGGLRCLEVLGAGAWASLTGILMIFARGYRRAQMIS